MNNILDSRKILTEFRGLSHAVEVAYPSDIFPTFYVLQDLENKMADLEKAGKGSNEHISWIAPDIDEIPIATPIQLKCVVSMDILLITYVALQVMENKLVVLEKDKIGVAMSWMAPDINTILIPIPI